MYVMHPYEDRELALEMLKQEALEEADTMNTATANPFLPDGFEGLIAGLAAKVQAAKPKPKKRVTLLAGAAEAVEKGLLPELIEITSEANLSYNNHLAKLHGFAKAGLRNAVEDYPIFGTNTYARLVKGYRDLLLKWLDAQVASKSPVAKPKPLAKKMSAAVATKVTTKASAKPTDTKSKSPSAKTRKAPAKKK